MKRINALIVLGLLLITGCMVYLVWRGVSLRSAPIIAPSIAEPDLKNVAASVVQRLHPQLEETRYLILGILPETEEDRTLLREMAANYELTFKAPVNIVENNSAMSPELVAACKRPCWILTRKDQAHSLGPSSPLQLPEAYISLSFLEFSNDETVTPECNQQKRLSFDCVLPVSVREVQRKIRNKNQRYFFLRQYGDRDFFLFLQKKVQS